MDKGQIIKALSLAYEENQDWPQSDNEGSAWSCLGIPESEMCARGALGFTPLNTALLRYISVIPRTDTGNTYPITYIYASDYPGWTDTQGTHPPGAYLIWIQEVDMPESKCPAAYRYINPGPGAYWRCYHYLGL